MVYSDDLHRSAGFPAVLAATLVLSFSGGSLRGADEIPLHGETVVRFASQDEARSVLAARDRFVDALSPFDRQSRLRTDKEVTAVDLADFAAQQALEWDADEKARVKTLVGRVREMLAGYPLPFPETVLLIKTTGQDEGGAAYCRQNAVVLPRNYLGFAPKRLEGILIHELFHILSSHNPDWRHALYEVIGFRPCPPLELPAQLKDRKITNPDAPHADAYIELDVEGQRLLAVPVLYASTESYDPVQGGSLFRYLVFRLMVVEMEAGSWRVAGADGQTVLLDPAEVPSFHRQIGGNTKYIIHPEEILADNFVHLIRGTTELPTPEIVERMRGLLVETPSPDP